MGVTGVENAGGGLMIGPESDMGDSMVMSGGGVGGRMGDGSVIGRVVEEWSRMEQDLVIRSLIPTGGGWSWMSRRSLD